MNDRAALQAVGTFMGVPASRDLSGSKAAVLGISALVLFLRQE